MRSPEPSILVAPAIEPAEEIPEEKTAAAWKVGTPSTFKVPSMSVLPFAATVNSELVMVATVKSPEASRLTNEPLPAAVIAAVPSPLPNVDSPLTRSVLEPDIAAESVIPFVASKL